MEEEKIIVCFGDSNTHGYNNKTGGRFDKNTRWPMVLQRLLGEEYLIREEGLSGRTTVFDDPLHESLSGVDVIRPILLTHEPVSLLIIMLGTNDVKERFSATPENISRGLDRLIKKAQDAEEAFAGAKPNILEILPLAMIWEREVRRSLGNFRNSTKRLPSRIIAIFFRQRRFPGWKIIPMTICI